jgi:predicted AAA+ superfamily ATPase
LININKNRYLSEVIQSDLKEKMVFLGGPRQVGKTTFSLSLLAQLMQREIENVDVLRTDPSYLNWDVLKSRKKIRDGHLDINSQLIILDEVHKYKDWKNLVKGFYDEYKTEKSFLITGSARLDLFKKGGDSLQGRYHYYRLHPFSLGEFTSPSKAEFEALLKFGGFPEPLLKGNEKFWRRWQTERLSKVINEDLRDLERVKDISDLEILADALPVRVGSPLSINNLRNDISVSHQTIERYIQIFENLYYCFRISPYGPPKIKAVKKEQKLYLWDWSVIEDEGSRFENLVASQLLKFCHFKQDTEGYKMELRYLRDQEGREVDFVVLQDKKPLFAVEAKLKETTRSSHLTYFQERTKIPEFYQVHSSDVDFGRPSVDGRVLPLWSFCKLKNLS